jgi:hypothetical protein
LVRAGRRQRIRLDRTGAHCTSGHLNTALHHSQASQRQPFGSTKRAFIVRSWCDSIAGGHVLRCNCRRGNRVAIHRGGLERSSVWQYDGALSRVSLGVGRSSDETRFRIAFSKSNKLDQVRQCLAGGSERAGQTTGGQAGSSKLRQAAVSDQVTCAISRA